MKARDYLEPRLRLSTYFVLGTELRYLKLSDEDMLKLSKILTIDRWGIVMIRPGLIHSAYRHNSIHVIDQLDLMNAELAIALGRLDVLEHYASKGYNMSNNQIGLMNVAIIHGNLDAVKFLDRYPTNYDVRMMSYQASAYDHIHILEYFNVQYDARHLEIAVRNGHPSLVSYLIENGVSPSQSLAKYAIRTGEPEVIRLLKEYGIEFDAQTFEDAKYAWY